MRSFSAVLAAASAVLTAATPQVCTLAGGNLKGLEGTTSNLMTTGVNYGEYIFAKTLQILVHVRLAPEYLGLQPVAVSITAADAVINIDLDSISMDHESMTADFESSRKFLLII